jgi:methionine synthase I (cobalamin-dependent)
MDAETVLSLLQRQPAFRDCPQGCVLSDGAMGTELFRRGVPLDACLEVLNLERPGLVKAIHHQYRAAGARLLLTNTFGANRCRLAAHGFQERVAEINEAGVLLARQEAHGALVAGSIGPTGLRDLGPVDAQAIFREQAAAQDRGGVDFYVCETFGDIGELEAAVRGVAQTSRRPIVASMVYGFDGRTSRGLTPSQVVHALRDLPLSGIGVNCADSGKLVERVIAQLHHATDLPLFARPNAGQPRSCDGKLVYPLGPDAFAGLAARLSTHAAFVGGCCGTTPAYIAAARQRLYRDAAEAAGQAPPA